MKSQTNLLPPAFFCGSPGRGSKFGGDIDEDTRILPIARFSSAESSEAEKSRLLNLPLSPKRQARLEA
tara:strand:+ start:136 stop:339 length:204 start_codon:yes stop_codon:yes gene_type:complete